MKTGTIILGMMLGISLLANAVFLVRLQDRDEAAKPIGVPASRPARAETASAGTNASPPIEARVPTTPDADPVAPALPSRSVSGKQGPAPVSLAAVRNDPQVLGVLEAQEEFGVFWKDLDRVFKARSKFDESKYIQTVIASVQDFLAVPESARPVFTEAMKSATASLGNARKEYDAARKALPPKDKSNASAYAVYQQQKDALDLRYQEQSKVAVDSVKQHLDLKQPRHAELSSNLEKLLRNLVPRPTQP